MTNCEIPRTILTTNEFIAKTDIAHAGNCRGNSDDFQRIAVSNVSLENKKLNRGEFHFSSFTDVTFTGINFDGSEFEFAQLERVTFKNCDLSSCEFDFAQMNDIVFVNCKLTNSSFDFVSGNISFSGCILQGAEFHHTMATLELKECSGERLEMNYSPALDIHAENCDFHRAEFTDSVFSGTMKQCCFTDAYFCGSNGESLKFDECIMRDINSANSTGIIIKDNDDLDDFDDLDFE